MRRTVTAVSAVALFALVAAPLSAAPRSLSFVLTRYAPTGTKHGVRTIEDVVVANKKVGTNHVTCVFHGRTKASCRLRLTLKGQGTIGARFTTGPKPTTWAHLTVTDGTGAFANPLGVTGTGRYRPGSIRITLTS